MRDPQQPAFDHLDQVRMLRNQFMHAKERGEEIDPVALTSTVFTAVDEASCRRYLHQLKKGDTQVYGQLPSIAAPVVVRDNVKWLGELESP